MSIALKYHLSALGRLRSGFKHGLRGYFRHQIRCFVFFSQVSYLIFPLTISLCLFPSPRFLSFFSRLLSLYFLSWLLSLSSLFSHLPSLSSLTNLSLSSVNFSFPFSMQINTAEKNLQIVSRERQKLESEVANAKSAEATVHKAAANLTKESEKVITQIHQVEVDFSGLENEMARIR